MIVLKPNSALPPIFGLFRPFALMLFLFWLLSGHSASAQEAEPLSRIEAAAGKQAQAVSPDGARISVGRIDERLRLAACPAPLAASSDAGNGASLSVQVRCDALGWKLYVPVTVNVQVPVLVATRGIARGQAVSAADVEVQMRDRATLGPAWFSEPAQLQGQVSARMISAGSVLIPAALTAERIVKRGQSVTIVGQASSFQVRAEGKALADGVAGELIRVENLSSRRVVQGEVLTDGSVRVGL